MKLIPLLVSFALILSATLVYAQREKGGTEDINIGVGELQQSSGETQVITGQGPATEPGAVRVVPGTAKPVSQREGKNKEDEAKAPMLVPAVQKARSTGYGKSKKGGNVETEWKVEKGE